MKFSRKIFFISLLIVAFPAQTGMSANAHWPKRSKTVLDQQGKADLPLDRVVDASVVEEVLGERR
jgi:hypothetical protein